MSGKYLKKYILLNKDVAYIQGPTTSSSTPATTTITTTTSNSSETESTPNLTHATRVSPATVSIENDENFLCMKNINKKDGETNK